MTHVLIGMIAAQVSLSAADDAFAADKAAAKPAWKRLTSNKGRFSAEFPAKPKYESEKDDEGNVSHTYMSEQAGGEIAYSIVYNDFGPEVAAAGSKAVFAGIVANFGKQVKSRKDIKHNGNPGIELRIEFKQKGVPLVIQNRIFLVKNRLYQVMVTATASKAAKADVARFHKSFKLLK